jgi:AcrR family transcriptional regulator
MLSELADGKMAKAGLLETPSLYVKNKGLKTVTQVSRETGVSPQTLDNWFKKKRALFDVVVDGVIARQNVSRGTE